MVILCNHTQGCLSDASDVQWRQALTHIHTHTHIVYYYTGCKLIVIDDDNDNVAVVVVDVVESLMIVNDDYQIVNCCRQSMMLVVGCVISCGLIKFLYTRLMCEIDFKSRFIEA